MAYSNYSLFSQIASLRSQLNALELKLDSEHPDSPIINFSSNELKQSEAVLVAGNEPTNYPSGNGWFYENEVLGFQKLDDGPNKKFNFYTHAYNTNLNDLTIGQCKGLVSQFTVKNINTNELMPQVVIFYAVYTKPKNDGSDMASWYNSRLVITNSESDERINSNITYSLEQDQNINTRKSTTFSQNDEILFVSIQSNSTEPLNNWVFKLEYLSVLTFFNSKEQELRILGDKKQVFSVASEYQGLMANDQYPFSYGYGSQSSSSFGYLIPFHYKLSGFTLLCDSSDVSPSINFQIINVPNDNTGSVVLVDKIMDSSKKVSELYPNSTIQKQGVLNIKIINATGLNDEFARYRLVLFLKCDDVL